MKEALSVILAVIMLCLAASVPAIAAESGETVSAFEMTDPVKIDSEVLTSSSYSTYYMARNTDIILCEQRGSVFFAGAQGLNELNLQSGECKKIESFGTIGYNYAAKYAANNKIYLLYKDNSDCYIKIFNLLTLSYEQSVPFSCEKGEAIGVDSKERFYIAATDADGNRFIYLLDKTGNILSKAAVEQAVYEFAGFNETNGDFFVIGFYNWVYWGYDHSVNAIRKGNVTSDTVKFNEDVIVMLSQQYYNARYNQAEMLGGKYLAADAPIKASYYFFDANDMGSGEKVTKSRPAAAFGYKSADAIGTRSVYMEASGSVISCTDPKIITETDINTNKDYGSFELGYSVFAMKTVGDRILVIEKDGADYYYQLIKWSRPTKVMIGAPSSTVKVGETLQLSAKTDSQLSQTYNWVSKNSKIASVNKDGKVYGWKSGSTDIVVTTNSGLTATLSVTVTGKRDDSTEALIVTESENELAANRNYNNYYVWSSPVCSYLNELENGEYAAISYYGGKVTIMRYNALLSRYLETKTIDAELPLFGGYFCGEKYNFLVFGQKNSDESDEVEVIRVVKYDKNWSRLGDTKISGINTLKPFDAGSLRMTETDGKLYIHTCHTMYKSDDGYNHQANMVFVIDQETGEVKDSFSLVMNIDYGYVSHSFNQFIATDGNDIYRADHGDAYPRGIAITKFNKNDEVTDVNYTVPMTFSGSIGDNYTGAAVGGMQLSDNEVLVAGSSIEKTEQTNTDRVFNIFVISTDKSLKDSKTQWLTDYTSADKINVGTPQLIKIGPEQFLMMWTETNKKSESVTKAVTLDSLGNITSDIVSRSVMLSDCQPVFTSDGRVRWYVSNGKKIWFYSIDPFRFVEEHVILGDANGDGIINIRDVTSIQRHVSEYQNVKSFKAADVDGNNVVNVQDATLIQRYLAEYEVEYSIGESI